MDAREQKQASERLGAALNEAGLVVERAVSEDGANLAQWEQVPASAVLGKLMQVSGWKVSVVRVKRGKVIGRIGKCK